MIGMQDGNKHNFPHLFCLSSKEHETTLMIMKGLFFMCFYLFTMPGHSKKKYSSAATIMCYIFLHEKQDVHLSSYMRMFLTKKKRYESKSIGHLKAH